MLKSREQTDIEKLLSKQLLNAYNMLKDIEEGGSFDREIWWEKMQKIEIAIDLVPVE